MTTIKVTGHLVIELGREGTTSHCATLAEIFRNTHCATSAGITPRATSAGMLSTAVQESGEEDGSDTVTVVTPRRLHVYHYSSKFPVPMQEVNAHASAELVC